MVFEWRRRESFVKGIFIDDFGINCAWWASIQDIETYIYRNRNRYSGGSPKWAG